MGMIKGRNGKDLTEAEEIKKKWQEYTGEPYKKNYTNDLDNHSGVVTHQEPDILESEVKWALWNIATNKTSGGAEIPAELFQILKDYTSKVLHPICQIYGKFSSGHRTGKGSFHSNLKEGQCQRMFKLLYNCAHFSC